MQGQKQISTFFAIDWVSATLQPFQAKRLGKVLGLGTWASDVNTTGMHGYNAGKELETGLRVMWHTENDSMGVHFSLSGACLRYYETKNLDGYSILKLIDKFKGRTSRIDLAIDIVDSDLTEKNIIRENLLPYKGKGRTPKFVTLLGDKGSWTVYIGSRSSEKFLRIYDKAKEQGDYVGSRVRVELEIKGDTAHQIGKAIPSNTKEWMVSMAQTLICGQANFNLPDWQTAFSSDRVEFGVPHGRERDTFGWLIKVCAPALAKEIVRRPKDGVLNEFWDALRRELNERGIVS